MTNEVSPSDTVIPQIKLSRLLVETKKTNVCLLYPGIASILSKTFVDVNKSKVSIVPFSMSQLLLIIVLYCKYLYANNVNATQRLQVLDVGVIFNCQYILVKHTLPLLVQTTLKITRSCYCMPIHKDLGAPEMSSFPLQSLTTRH